jgi:hypothetical protein
MSKESNSVSHQNHDNCTQCTPVNTNHLCNLRIVEGPLPTTDYIIPSDYPICSKYEISKPNKTLLYEKEQNKILCDKMDQIHNAVSHLIDETNKTRVIIQSLQKGKDIRATIKVIKANRDILMEARFTEDEFRLKIEELEGWQKHFEIELLNYQLNDHPTQDTLDKAERRMENHHQSFFYYAKKIQIGDVYSENK